MSLESSVTQSVFRKICDFFKVVFTRSKCNKLSFWETRPTPPWPIWYGSESILCFYPRTSKCCCAPHGTPYSLQSLGCPLSPCIASPAAPSRCELTCRDGCRTCALLPVCIAEMLFGLHGVSSSAHPGWGQLPPLPLRQPRHHGERWLQEDGGGGIWAGSWGWQRLSLAGGPRWAESS